MYVQICPTRVLIDQFFKSRVSLKKLAAEFANRLTVRRYSRLRNEPEDILVHVLRSCTNKTGTQNAMTVLAGSVRISRRT